MTTVAEGHFVSIHYTGRLDSGEVFDSSEGREPIGFIVGRGRVIPGFERGVIGLSVGGEKTFAIPPAEAYGQRDDKKLIDISKDQIGDHKPEIGDEVGLQLADGHQVRAVIAKVTENGITVDLNHPLAGKTLHFSIKVVEVREARPEDEPEESCCSSHECGGCSTCEGHG